MSHLARAFLLLALTWPPAAGCGGEPDTMDPAGPPGTPGQPGTPGTIDPGDPGPAGGFQIASPSFVLQPGEELFRCLYTSLPSDTEIALRQIRSTMTPGSHHLILYSLSSATQPDGTFDDCSSQAGGPDLRNLRVWLYAAQDPQHESAMPSGVAIPLKAHQPLLLNLHYLNATPKPITVQAVVRGEPQQGAFQRAGAFVTFNTQIAIPGHGTQTVSGHCKAPQGAQFFTMSTHAHKHSTAASISTYRAGQVAGQLVQTTDWEHPGVVNWQAPFLTLQTGEEIYYTCTYKNDTDDVIRVGESAVKDEMCMAIGYYFPATGTAFCLNSLPINR